MEIVKIELPRDEECERAVYDKAMLGEIVPINEETRLDRTGFELKEDV